MPPNQVLFNGETLKVIRTNSVQLLLEACRVERRIALDYKLLIDRPLKPIEVAVKKETQIVGIAELWEKE